VRVIKNFEKEQWLGGSSRKKYPTPGGRGEQKSRSLLPHQPKHFPEPVEKSGKKEVRREKGTRNRSRTKEYRSVVGGGLLKSGNAK